ncbi:MAG: hypothetical protein CVT79_00805 [Alphaproteobacteria bacterium HGW-Alphaproteobacteria-18]|nr:MAG: hypothetical protein CVT79_00805 [Alphaproteobacteria bacterium HGW-Alphaproteobacteria-18]
MSGGGFRWLGLVLLGPAIWAVTFAGVYALHGAGCALGWSTRMAGPLTLHHLVMLAGWTAGIGAGIWFLVRMPAGRDRSVWIPRIGGIIGLASTVFTLLPLLFASSC